MATSSPLALCGAAGTSGASGTPRSTVWSLLTSRVCPCRPGRLVAVLTALAILGVLAALFLAAVLATRESEGLAPAPPDVADLALPDGPLSAEDVRGARFGLSLRGYRMSEVDALLARVSEQLAERDGVPDAVPEPAPAVEPTDVDPLPAATAADGPAVEPAQAAVVEPDVEPAPVGSGAVATPAAVVDEPAPAVAPPALAPPASDAAFSAADDLDFPEVSLPDVDDAPAPDLSVGQAPVEPVDPPLRSS